MTWTCGINGFTWEDGSLLHMMNLAIRHRGPDHEGARIKDGLSLGHVRLTIIDPSSAGNQPMSNENGDIWITYNGEVYNHSDLRNALEQKGHIFKSKTDTEVILHSYEEYGPDCVKKLNGMWAFALLDGRKNLLILSRDRFGIKPLFFCRSQKGLIFSSEIKGVLELQFTLRVAVEKSEFAPNRSSEQVSLWKVMHLGSN